MKVKRLLLFHSFCVNSIWLCLCPSGVCAYYRIHDLWKAADSNALNESFAAATEAPALAPEAVAGGADAASATAVKQMVIMNASLSILVDDPTIAMADIMKMATDMGGFTVNSNSYQTYTSNGVQIPAASVTVRVPAEKLNQALDQIKALTGDPKSFVTSENVSGQDVTQDYTDLQSRLRNLQEAETELTKMYEKAQDASDVLAIYQQKLQVTEQIEVIKGQMQYFEEASAKSAITVTIAAKASTQPVTIAGWQPKGVALDAVRALVNFLKGFVNFLIRFFITVLPILLILGLFIGLPIYLLIRWLVRRKKAKSGQLPPLPTEKK
jgi:hypothetical protein